MKTLVINFRLKTDNEVYDVQYRYSEKKGFLSIWFGSTMFTREASNEINRVFHDYMHRKIDAKFLNDKLKTFFKSLL